MAQQKFTLDAQLEEIGLAISDLPCLNHKKSLIEFRTSRLRAIQATLRWMKQNEAAIRHWLVEQKSKNAIGEATHGS